MLFIPEAWSHATVNIGDAVGVNLEGVMKDDTRKD